MRQAIATIMTNGKNTVTQQFMRKADAFLIQVYLSQRWFEAKHQLVISGVALQDGSTFEAR